MNAAQNHASNTTLGSDPTAPEAADAEIRVLAQRTLHRLLVDGLDLYAESVDFDTARDTYLSEMRLADATPSLREEVLLTALASLRNVVACHQHHGCIALTSGDLTRTVEAFVCGCYCDRRDIARVARYGHRPTGHQFATFRSDPDHWLPIIIMTTAAAMTHTAPYDLAAILG